MTERSLPHDVFMLLAMEVAEGSHCVKYKVGAVLVKDGHILATGYNGPSIANYHCDEMWPLSGCMRSLRGGCMLSLHAEQNVIFKALTNHIDLKDSTLYVTLSPCLPCARMILGAGIGKVTYKDSYATYKKLPLEEGLAFLHTYGIITEKYTPHTYN